VNAPQVGFNHDEHREAVVFEIGFQVDQSGDRRPAAPMPLDRGDAMLTVGDMEANAVTNPRRFLKFPRGTCSAGSSRAFSVTGGRM
jgi:hypothetical protein